MGVTDVLFSEDMVLDEEAFSTAASDFSELSKKLQRLRGEIEDMLNTLRTGFDTPAGRMFTEACEKNLFGPLDDQKIVLDHISLTLLSSKQAYESVFREYEALQKTINSVKMDI